MPPKTTQTDWEPHRNEIYNWYIFGKMSAPAIAERLGSEGRMDVNTRQVQLRLQQWGYTKTNTNQGQVRNIGAEYTGMAWSLMSQNTNQDGGTNQGTNQNASTNQEENASR